MHESKPPISEQILDLLLDALQERQTAQQAPPEMVPSLETAVINSIPEPIAAPPSVETAVLPIEEEREPAPPLEQPDIPLLLEKEIETAVVDPPPPGPPAFINLEHTLGRIIFALILLVVAINIPFNIYGTNLARAMPDSAALVIRNGLLLTGSGEEVYVLEDNQLRWITSIDAFEWYGYRWENVHQVDDDYLAQFSIGDPVHLLLKCSSSPHVFALEDGEKRWIKDIQTFNSLGYEWEQIQTVGCSYIDRLPLGVPIPIDAGTPPD